MTNIFTKEDLLMFNEAMLGRGVPVTEDGIGYNKADYGACATYFYGLSDAQYADLAKRLVKYTQTQLHLDKDMMKETAKHFAEIAGDGDRSEGISLDIREDGTLVSFRYNETFIDVIRGLPKQFRKWDAENKNWIVSNGKVIPLLNELWTVGADVKNALEYAMKHENIKKAIDEQTKKVEVITRVENGKVILKFPYDQYILNTIKEIEFKDRKWNAEHKFWSIEPKHLDGLKVKLKGIAEFKVM